jgi:hypothetical protein
MAKSNVYNACAYDEFWTKDKLRTDDEIASKQLKSDEYC